MAHQAGLRADAVQNGGNVFVLFPDGVLARDIAAVAPSAPVHQDAGEVRAENASDLLPVAVIRDAAVHKYDCGTASYPEEPNGSAVLRQNGTLHHRALDAFASCSRHDFSIYMVNTFRHGRLPAAPRAEICP
jgi:hypothetical protein